MAIIKSLLKFLLPAGELAESKKDLQYWRNFVINHILFIAVVLGFFALVPSILLSIKEGLYFVVGFDALLYSLTVYLFIRRDLPYRSRSMWVIIGTLAVGLVIYMVLGPFSAGPIWLFAFPILAGGLRGPAAAAISLIINAFILALTGFLLANNILGWSASIENPVEKWAVISVNFILLNSLAAGVVTILLNGLEKALKSENFIRSSLQDERDLLTQTNKKLKHEMQERIRTLEALRENEEKYRSLIESSDDPIYVLNRDLQYVYANKSTEKRLNKKGVELIGGSYKDYHPNHEIRDFETQVRKVLTLKKSVKFEFKCSRDGEHFVRTISPIKSESERITAFTVISKNISEYLRLERQLQQAQKMESIGNLAGGIAHDFNNLLTIINGYSEMMLSELDKESDQYNQLSEISQAGIKASAMTRQLLAFSRKQVLEKKIHNPAMLISEMEKLLGRLLGEEYRLKIRIGENTKPILADGGQIEQVLMNLVINARDASRPGSEIRISCRNHFIKHSADEAGNNPRAEDFVIISVADDGEGMQPGTVDKIFEPFFTTKETGSGTGLGLSVVYGIIRQHDGWIDVKSEPGKGTEFIISLPAVTTNPDNSIENTDDANRYDGNGERIMFVEDDPSVRLVGIMLLEKSKYQVFSAETLQEADELFQRENGNFDLLICDVILPDGNGAEFSEELAGRNPDLKVILNSGYTAEKLDLDKILKKGFHFVHKPYSVQNFLKLVNELVSRH